MAENFSNNFRSFTESLARSNRRLVGAETNAAEVRAGREQQIVDAQGNKTIDSLFKASPGLKKGYDALSGQLDGLGPTRLESELENQAFADLQLGGRLSEEDERNASQAARAAFSSRGLLYSTPSAAAEILNRQNMVDARRNERRGFAANVNESVNNRRGQDRSFASTFYNQTFSTLDPFERVFAGYSRQGGGSGMTGAAAEGALGMSRMEQDKDAFAQRLQFDRDQLAAEIEQANLTRQSNTKGAVAGGVLGAFGNIFGGWLGGR